MKISINIPLLVFLVQLSTSAIRTIMNYTITNSTGGQASALGYDSTSEFLITNILNSVTNQMLILSPNFTTTPLTIDKIYTAVTDSSQFQYRTKSSNILSTLTTNSKSLRFNISSCWKFNNLSVNSPFFYTQSPAYLLFKQCTFVATGPVAQHIAVYENTMISKTLVSIYDSTTITMKNLYLTWTTFMTFVRGFEKNGLFYMLFKDGFCVLLADATLTEVIRITWPLNSASIFDLYGNYLACSSGFNLSIYDTTNNFSLVFNLTLVETIFNLRFFNSSQVLIMTATGIYQYNIQTSAVTNSLMASFNSTNAFDFLGGRFLFVYNKYPVTYSQILLYAIDNTTNATSTVNMTNTTNSEITTVSGSDEEELWFLTEAGQYSVKISMDLGNLIRISSSKVTAKPFLLIIMILDDLEYYQYHKINYTQAIQFVIINVIALNNIRFDSLLLQATGLNEDLQEQFAFKQALYDSQFPKHDKNPSFFYFLNSTKQTYVDNLFFCIFVHLILKTFHLIAYIFSDKHALLGKLNVWFSLNTKWWMLLAIIFQNNMASLTFASFVQLQGSMVSSFNFGDKMNLATAVLTLFSLVSYSFCFYLIIYAFTHEKISKNLLSESYCTAGGFFWQSFSRIVRNLLRCFFHGFFIFNYRLQILGLAWSNILYVIATLIFKKQICSTFFFLLYLMYYMVFFVFDLALLLKFSLPNLFKKLNFNFVTFILICILVGIAILLLLISIMSAILRLAGRIISGETEASNIIEKNKIKKVNKVQKINKNSPQNCTLIPVIKLVNQDRNSQNKDKIIAEPNPKRQSKKKQILTMSSSPQVKDGQRREVEAEGMTVNRKSKLIKSRMKRHYRRNEEGSVVVAGMKLKHKFYS